MGLLYNTEHLMASFEEGQLCGVNIGMHLSDQSGASSRISLSPCLHSRQPWYQMQ